MGKAEKIHEIESLMASTPDGVIADADTVLADLVDQTEFTFTGFAQDVFNIWKKSSDKKAVEDMFYEFTDTEFSDFLDSVLAVMSAQAGAAKGVTA